MTQLLASTRRTCGSYATALNGRIICKIVNNSQLTHLDILGLDIFPLDILGLDMFSLDILGIILWVSTFLAFLLAYLWNQDNPPVQDQGSKQHQASTKSADL